MPLQPGDIDQVRISQGAISAEDGRILRVKNVSYMVRGQGPFSIQVPEAEFNLETVKQLIEREAQQIVAILEIS